MALYFPLLPRFKKTLVPAFLLLSTAGFAQTGNSDGSETITLEASDSYKKGKLYKLLWGEHYRKEWNTPVTVRKVSLDTLSMRLNSVKGETEMQRDLVDTVKRGLIPYQTGGSRQTKSIRVTDKNGREYAFRSVDKTFGGALPEITQNTFIEKLANDQVTISHPYGALIVAPLAAAAKIYHASPELLYVPKQPALKQFNDSMGDIMYLLEQRPDGDWSTEPNFGNSKKIVSTEKMLEKILEDNDNSVDQKAFARARLFDMWIGDWGRHEDQWRWATFKDDKKTLYVPIPRDRDNAFTKFDGFLLRMAISAAKAKHLQTFDNDLKDVNRFNFPARHMDHHLLNQVTSVEWVTIANDLKARLTDDVIDNAVKQLPSEVYPISGPEIASKLKARREHLSEWANTYYNFLSTDVEITGTEKHERFEVNRISDEETEVNIYKINKEGEVKKKALYHRVFKTNETNEIRLYGISGNDEYVLNGKVNKGIKVRLIGGPEKDSYKDESIVSGPSHKTKIYDNPGNDLLGKTKETEVYTSADSSINRYEYKYFNYGHRKMRPLISYNNADRLHVGLAYNSIKHKWRKYPFANTQHFDVKYSISQQAFSSTYSSVFTELVGKWNLRPLVNFDGVRWTNFFGLGNETKLTQTDRNFNRVRSMEFIAKINTDRVIRNTHRITTGIGYQTYKILNDPDRFIKQAGIISPAAAKHETFAIAEAEYVFQKLNDSVLPVRGISLLLYGNYADNINRSKNNVGKYGGEANFYIPLGKKFNVMIRGGGSSLSGEPDFYQYNRIGGTQTLRGYRRERFYGESVVFNQNELRFITNLRSFLYNGKIGLFGLYDAGRVWLEGEKSDTWHTAYGGGIILSPFNRMSIAVSYAVSPEDANINLKFIRPF